MKNLKLNISFQFEKFTLVLLIILCIYGCKNSKTELDISEFYFPQPSKGEIIISDYVTIKTGRDTQQMTWHYTSTSEDLLLAKGYNRSGQILQERTEQIFSNGVELKALTAYMPDSTGQYHPTEAGIIYDDVFPFDVKPDGGVFLYKIELPDPILDGVVRTITRNRRYLRDTSVAIQGKNIDGIIFDYKESIEDIREGRLTLDFYGQETYLIGIGLYERIRNYEGSLFDVVRLDNISQRDTE